MSDPFSSVPLGSATVWKVESQLLTQRRPWIPAVNLCSLTFAGSLDFVGSNNTCVLQHVSCQQVFSKLVSSQGLDH